MRYIQPVTETLRAMLALGWTIDPSGVCHEDDGTGIGYRRRQFGHNVSPLTPICIFGSKLKKADL